LKKPFLWYFEINPIIADKFESSLFTELEHIQSSSENFQARYKNIKVRFLPKFPYGVHYFIKDSDTVLIVGVFHTSKDPKNWFDRIK